MNENKTNTLLLTVIGVATLLVAVIGATFAYFTAQVGGAESSTTINVTAGTLTIDFGEKTDASLTFNGEEVIPTTSKTSCKFTDTGITKIGTLATDGWYCAESNYDPIAQKTFTITGVNNVTTSQGNMKMPYTLELYVTTNEFTSNTLKYTLGYTNNTTTGNKNANDEFAEQSTWKNIATGVSKITLGTGSFGPQAGVAEATGSGKARTKDDNIHTYVLKIFFPDNNVPQDADKDKEFSALVNVTSQEIVAK